MADEVINNSESDRTPTAVTSTAAQQQSALPKRRRRWNAQLVVGLVIVIIAGVTALAAPLISPFDPDAQQLIDRLQAPSSAHWAGTDNFGRDVLSRLFWGGRISLAVGLLSMIIAVSMGVLVGSAAGFFGGYVDAILMRLTELVMVFPTFFLLILIVATFGSSVPVLIFMIGFTSWPVGARIIRGEVLKINAREYILAANALGMKNSRIIIRHILPNIVSVIIISATIRVGINILIEAGLSFLGLGVQPPDPSWGNMVASGAAYLSRAWWLVAVPGGAIFATVLAFNLMGEGLRDLLDPRRGKGRAL